MPVTSQPVRSLPNGYGIGVRKPKTESAPTGEVIKRQQVRLGVGVTVKAILFDAEPPNVAVKLETNRSRSAGAT
jgi:hypothetical protein